MTIKDTLEGDNMYTCSQCGKKVRAEKRWGVCDICVNMNISSQVWRVIALALKVSSDRPSDTGWSQFDGVDEFPMCLFCCVWLQSSQAQVNHL